MDETWDGQLNDILGFHLTAEHVVRALASAQGGTVADGPVGGGTGTTCYDFEAGIGTASRVVTIARDTHRVGVLVQTNYGRRPRIRIAGGPVGAELAKPVPILPTTPHGDGSIVVIIAIDAPLLPSQLRFLAKRALLGWGQAAVVSARARSETSFTGLGGEGGNLQGEEGPLGLSEAMNSCPQLGRLDAREPVAQPAEGGVSFSVTPDTLRAILAPPVHSLR